MTLGPFSVVNTALLWGAALVAVPVLIHLFNKRRFRIVEWAAMELLRKVQQQNRRRLRVEHLLILLLRCLIVLLLTLLVARVILGGATGLGRGGGRVERIFVLDDSPSMEVRQGNRTIFSRATAALADYVRQLARSRPGDTLTVILTSAPDQPFLSRQVLGGDRGQSVAAAVEALAPSAVPARFEQVLAAVQGGIAREPGGRRTVGVISDFRRQDWLGRDSSAPRQLGSLAASVSDLVLVNVGEAVASDMAIVDLRCEERIAVAGAPGLFRVGVANRGSVRSEGAVVTVAADGAPAGRISVPAMAPGESRSFSLPVSFARSGPVAVEAELADSDQLAFDNRRSCALTVEPAIRVLVVDGESDPEPFRRESFYLRRALMPPGDVASGVRVEVVDETTFDPATLDTAHVLVLCNVYRMAREHWQAVAGWVRQGGGLVVFPGDQVDGANWNDMAREGGAGCLPARFGEMAGDLSEKEWQTLRIVRPDHAVLQVFSGDRNPFLQRVKVFGYWRLDPSTDASPTILATLANGAPALVESLFGAGRVLMFAMAADDEWSNWPSDPSYVVTLQQAVRTVARAASSDRVLAVGESLRHEVSPSLYRGDASLYPPQGHEAELLRATASNHSSRVVFQHGAVWQPGIWSLELTTHEGALVRLPFAVNVPVEESLLEGGDSDELRRRAANPRVRLVKGPAIPDANDAAGGQRELGLPLVLLLLGMLMLEQSLAWWFGRMRRVE